MYSYAGSFKVDLMAQDEWQAAFAQAAIKKVEISTSDVPEQAVLDKLIPDMLRLQEAGSLDAASLHLPFAPFEKINCASPDETLRKATVKVYADYIKRFACLNIPNITMHCGGEPNAPEDRKMLMQNVRRSCEELLPVLEECNTSLNLELLPRTCIGNVVEELLEISDGLPLKHVGICLDVNHGMDQGVKIPQMILQCGERLKTFHISDYDNRDECHWNVGEGMLDWVAIQDAIRQMPQELLAIIEVKEIVIPAWRNYKIDHRYNIQNIERNCMKMEFPREMQQLMEKIKASGFTGVQ
ncbi:MAG: sugar phosphate isomerase/epimerase [Lentisphaeria bacterium]|nr:sugar phosphate isomerase/epimerase [Lentisphaeria bacterium]